MRKIHVFSSSNCTSCPSLLSLLCCLFCPLVPPFIALLNAAVNASCTFVVWKAAIKHSTKLFRLVLAAMCVCWHVWVLWSRDIVYLSSPSRQTIGNALFSLWLALLCTSSGFHPVLYILIYIYFALLYIQQTQTSSLHISLIWKNSACLEYV